jgi:hypothetical protein
LKKLESVREPFIGFVEMNLKMDSVLKTKFCFSCQRDRNKENGSYIVRKGNKQWKCMDCQQKRWFSTQPSPSQSPVTGLDNEKHD